MGEGSDKRWYRFDQDVLYRVEDLAERWGCTVSEATGVAVAYGLTESRLPNGAPLMSEYDVECIEKIAGESIKIGDYRDAEYSIHQNYFAEITDGLLTEQRDTGAAVPALAS